MIKQESVQSYYEWRGFETWILCCKRVGWMRHPYAGLYRRRKVDSLKRKPKTIGYKHPMIP